MLTEKEKENIESFMKAKFSIWAVGITKMWQTMLTTQKTFKTDYTIDTGNVSLKIVESYINAIDLIRFSLFYSATHFDWGTKEKPKTVDDCNNLNKILEYFDSILNYNEVCSLFYSLNSFAPVGNVIAKEKLKVMFSKYYIVVKKLIDFADKMRWRSSGRKVRRTEDVGSKYTDKTELEDDLSKNMPSDTEVDKQLDAETGGFEDTSVDESKDQPSPPASVNVEFE